MGSDSKNDRHVSRPPSDGPNATVCFRFRSSRSSPAVNSLPRQHEQPRLHPHLFRTPRQDHQLSRLLAQERRFSEACLRECPPPYRSRRQRVVLPVAVLEPPPAREQPKVRSSQPRGSTLSSATSIPEGASRRRICRSDAPRSRVACSTFAAITRSYPCASKPCFPGSRSMSSARKQMSTSVSSKRRSASAKNPTEISVNS